MEFEKKCTFKVPYPVMFNPVREDYLRIEIWSMKAIIRVGAFVLSSVTRISLLICTQYTKEKFVYIRIDMIMV